MITLCQGSLLEAEAEALVNTVNCVGVMGKGIALQFKQAYPENFRQYERACRAGEVQLGKMFPVATNALAGPRYIINFPTKNHWRAKSRIADIDAGLADLTTLVQRLDIRSIAIPSLGCGNGGLDWEEVRPRIEAAFADLPHVHVLLYRPQPAPDADSMLVATTTPTMTRARALVILLIARYHEPGYRLTMLELQKLAYFLQEAGEELRLRYVKNKFGPYADSLNHVVQRLEGHFLRGYGDRSRGAEIYPIRDAVAKAQAALANDPDARQRLDRVSRLIEGYEYPYGMELLSSIHWIAREHREAAADPETAAEHLYAWNERKRSRFQREHVHKGWERLKAEDWLPRRDPGTS